MTTTSFNFGVVANRDAIARGFDNDYSYADRLESEFNSLAKEHGSSATLCTHTSSATYEIDEPFSIDDYENWLNLANERISEYFSS